jgi:hypothetical protein
MMLFRIGAKLWSFTVMVGLVICCAADADAQLTASSPATAANPVNIVACSAAGAPSPSGTADYYLVLSARYQNQSKTQTVNPILIRFDLLDDSGKVVASQTVVDANGLAPQFGNVGRWQSIGYPKRATRVTCSIVTKPGA